MSLASRQKALILKPVSDLKTLYLKSREESYSGRPFLPNCWSLQKPRWSSERNDHFCSQVTTGKSLTSCSCKHWKKSSCTWDRHPDRQVIGIPLARKEFFRVIDAQSGVWVHQGLGKSSATAEVVTWLDKCSQAHLKAHSYAAAFTHHWASCLGLKNKGQALVVVPALPSCENVVCHSFLCSFIPVETLKSISFKGILLMCAEIGLEAYLCAFSTVGHSYHSNPALPLLDPCLSRLS